MRRDEKEDQTPCDLVEGCVKVIEHRGTTIGMLLFVLRRHLDFGRMKREARTICEKEEQGNRGQPLGTDVKKTPNICQRNARKAGFRFSGLLRSLASPLLRRALNWDADVWKWPLFAAAWPDPIVRDRAITDHLLYVRRKGPTEDLIRIAFLHWASADDSYRYLSIFLITTELSVHLSGDNTLALYIIQSSQSPCPSYQDESPTKIPRIHHSESPPTTKVNQPLYHRSTPSLAN